MKYHNYIISHIIFNLVRYLYIFFSRTSRESGRISWKLSENVEMRKERAQSARRLGRDARHARDERVVRTEESFARVGYNDNEMLHDISTVEFPSRPSQEMP